jgi:hypothetical protein
MSAAIRLAAFCAALALSAAQSLASTTVGIYAIIDEVTFEPSDFEADRVWISGVFVVPQPISSGLHRLPLRGHLYFGLSSAAPNSTRTDWEALRKAAGTGQVVGFGNYWMPCSKARFPGLPAESNCSLEVAVHTDRSAAVPEPYPAPNSEGVVTVFDSHDDRCPRFGRSSTEIIAELRHAHSPGVLQNDTPGCAERVGLVSSSDLDSVFAAQTRDSPWAEDTEALILGRLARVPSLELADLAVECRDTICHVHLVFPTREYQEATGNRLAAEALSELPGFAQGGKIIPPRDEAAIDYYLQRNRVPAAQATAAE